MNQPTPIWAEIRHAHREEENGFIVAFIDAWKTSFTDNEIDEEGKVIAKVVGAYTKSGEPTVYVTYQDTLAQVDAYAQAAIRQATQDVLRELTGDKSKKTYTKTNLLALRATNIYTGQVKRMYVESIDDAKIELDKLNNLQHHHRGVVEEIDPDGNITVWSDHHFGNGITDLDEYFTEMKVDTGYETHDAYTKGRQAFEALDAEMSELNAHTN